MAISKQYGIWRIGMIFIYVSLPRSSREINSNSFETKRCFTFLIEYFFLNVKQMKAKLKFFIINKEFSILLKFKQKTIFGQLACYE